MNEAVADWSDEEYERTPINERGEEEKFYLQKIKSFYEDGRSDKFAFLNLDIDGEFFWLSTAECVCDQKNQFTQKEIDKIKEEQHTDLSEFKQIPVESVIIYE